MKLVSIISVNYNQPQITEDFLHSVISLNEYPHIEIIVVDNGSSENRTPEWRERYPDMTFIRSEENLGFAGGNNLGIAQARGDYFFLVNNDTEFTADLLSQLVQTLESDPRIGMVSPLIHYFDDKTMIQYAGYTPINYMTGRNQCIGQYEINRSQYNHRSGETGYIHGAAMLVMKEAIDRAGRMDPNYFLYYEELDWCERIKKAGYSMHVNTNALIYHKESVSVGKRSLLKEFFMTRNRILFLRKNAPPLSYLIFCLYFACTVLPRNLLVYLKNGEYTYIKVFLSAIAWHFTHRADSPDLGYPLKKYA
jgi:GT2 family glycosyltransferase